MAAMREGGNPVGISDAELRNGKYGRVVTGGEGRAGAS